MLRRNKIYYEKAENGLSRWHEFYRTDDCESGFDFIIRDSKIEHLCLSPCFPRFIAFVVGDSWPGETRCYIRWNPYNRKIVMYNQKKRKRTHKLYSIDVLTDGSEETGLPCLFLSLWGSSVDTTSTRPGWWEGSPKARYALYLGSDTCSRLATDQRFKLAATKAVFSDSLWGWKSIQLALHRAGAEKVHLVTSHPRVEKIVDLRNEQCPSVHLCDLSEFSQSITPGKDMADASWWQVYEDANILVHGKAIHQTTGSTSWAFLYTILSEDGSRRESESLDNQHMSFLVFPPGTDISKENTTHIKSLPLINNRPLQCYFLLALQPTGDLGISRDVPIFIVRKKDGPCRNLLVRARLQAQAWHEQCPRFFPLTQICTDDFPHTKSEEGMLQTGTSLYWWDNDDVSHDATDLIFHRQDRMLSFQEKSSEDASESEFGSGVDSSPPRHTWPGTLQKFLKSPVLYCSVCDTNDTNEIDLDGIDEDDQDSPQETAIESNHQLELFCLGTGCAAPSAYRGASAYLLSMRGITPGRSPSNILFEAGEGVVTQYQRHVSAEIKLLHQISLIYISHAHWDHYGGLVPLLDAIRRERLGAGDHNVQAPLVMGPRVVIRFCKNMLNQKQQGEWFYGVAHEDKSNLRRALDVWNKQHDSKIAFWENVLVDHSCRSSYGCILGVRIPGRQHFSIAFSGDTRPCPRFIQACRRQGVQGEIDFLLHEATFDDEEKEMSIKKKHSTIQEAIRVGRDVRARKVLLSHFSQRYDSLPKIPENMNAHVGFALDGMRINLV